MPSTTINPSNVQQSASGWLNPINAKVGDAGAYSLHVPPAGDYLYFSFPADSLPAMVPIQGIRLTLNACEIPGNPSTGLLGLRTLTFQFSKDGINYVGSSLRSTDLNGTGVMFNQFIGGTNEMFGLTWTAAELNSATLRIRVQRPIGLGDEDTTGFRSVESLTLTVFYGTAMPYERVTELQQCIIANETTPGTAVAGNRRIKSWMFDLQPQNETKELRQQGDSMPQDEVLISEACEASVNGYLTFDELGYLLASIIGKPVTTTLVAGAFRHQFTLQSRSKIDTQSYSMEQGDATSAEKVNYGLLSEFSMNTGRKDNSLSGKFIARSIGEGAALAISSVNDVQTLTMGTATSFFLRFRGAVTTSLTTAGLTAGQIQTALQALSTVGASNMTVSGSGPYVITAAAGLGGQLLSPIEIHAFTGGTTPTLARTTPGGHAEDPCTPILPGMWSMFYSSSQAALGTGPAKLTRLFGSPFSISSRFTPFWVMDAALSSWAGAIDDEMTIEFKPTVMADAVATAMVTDLRNRVAKWVRLEAVGPAIAATGFNYTFTIDMAAKVKLVGNFKEEGKIKAREFAISGRTDSTWGQSIQFVLINDKASY